MKVKTSIFNTDSAPSGRDVRAVKQSMGSTAKDVYATGKNDLSRDVNKTKSPGELGGLKGFTS